jgi:ribulose-5-phosphate 4-epimerase/fuculose-1-phosphate aldolase
VKLAQADDRMSDLALALIQAGCRVANSGLSWGTSGNLSARLSAHHFLISASGFGLGDLTRERLVTLSMESPEPPGTRAPSVEAPTHREIYRRRRDARAILHASPKATTLISTSSLVPNPDLTTDTAYYLRRVAIVAFQPPGTAQLATAVADAAENADVLLLRNHGAVTLGTSLELAVTRMECLEFLSWMTVQEAFGLPLRPLASQQIEQMRNSLSTYGGES